jgi:hypothetical protein
VAVFCCPNVKHFSSDRHRWRRSCRGTRCDRGRDPSPLFLENGHAGFGMPALRRIERRMIKKITDVLFMWARRRDWNRAIRTPGGLWPNEAVSVRVWSGRRGELDEAAR